MYEVFFETERPYGKSFSFGSENQVANDPEYRPEIPAYIKSIESVAWYMDLMVQCWNHNASERPDFVSIRKLIETHSSKL